MRVSVLGSGSRGNAVAVTSRGCTVLVDAGFGARTLEERAAGAYVDLERLQAILLTHEHGDHARGAEAIARAAGCPVYATPGTLGALGLQGVATVPLSPRRPESIGPFRVRVGRTPHDAAEPVAFRLSERGGDQRLGIALDVGRPTAGLRSLLRHVTGLILEANHDDGMLQAGPYPAAVRSRIAGPSGHLSNRLSAELAAELCHTELRVVVLAHLSDQCNRAELARTAVSDALARRGFRGRLFTAGQTAALAPFELGARQYTLGMFD